MKSLLPSFYITFIIKTNRSKMYKNKIINRLQRINHYQERTPDKVRKQGNTNQMKRQSTRRGKLSLSKDLSNNSIPRNTDSHDSQRIEKSESKDKRKYIHVVSGNKEHSQQKISLFQCNKLASSISLSKCGKETPKRSPFFQQKTEKERQTITQNDFREMAVNLAKSAAILKEKIVPVLLQAAANQLNKREEKEGNLQTPVRMFKDKDSFGKESRTVYRKLKTQGSQNYGIFSKYKSKHEIQRSPAPIKPKNLTDPQTLPKQFSISTIRDHTRSESLFFDQQLHPLASQLQSINIQRIQLQNRISRKLDQLSQRTISMTKQEVHLQPNPKKHRVLCLTSMNPVPQKPPSDISEPRKLRAEIMNRIFS